MVRSIATQEAQRETRLKRPALCPFPEAVHPGAMKKITTLVKAKVKAADNANWLAHSAGLVDNIVEARCHIANLKMGRISKQIK